MLPVTDGEEVVLRANDQEEWLVSWHPLDAVPDGTRHGSAGICVADAAEIVIVSSDGARWDLPAGRPDGNETWEETLRREMLEEACATVQQARLLGFSRGRCIRGHEQGLVLVRSFWRADVVLNDWEPEFEIAHRKLVPAPELLASLELESGHLRLYRRALDEAGIA